MSNLNKIDVLAGLFVIVIACLSLVQSLSLDMGSARNMGPGYFPFYIGLILFAVGVGLILSGRRPAEEAPEFGTLPTLRSILLILAAVISFALLIERFGMLPATAAAVFLGTLADREVLDAAKADPRRGGADRLRPHLQVGSEHDRRRRPVAAVMGDFFANISLGFSVALSAAGLGWCFIGVALGTFVGVLPGIGALAAIALLLPLTFGLEPTYALIMLAGIYYGSNYGGGITSILLNLPGTPTSAVTCIDGYPMARNGRAGVALFTTAMASFFGSAIGMVIMAIFSPMLAERGAALQRGGVFLADGAGPRRGGDAGVGIAA